MLLFARRLDENDGSFGGVVIAGIALKRLNQLFSRLDLGPHGTVSLRDMDLALIVGYPDAPSLGSDASQNAQTAELHKRIDSGEQFGLFKVVPIANDMERTVAFRRVGLYPFFVMVALSTDDYLADWRFEAIAVACFGGIFLLSTIGVAWQFFRSWSHRAITYQMLRDSEERLRLLAENATDTISRFNLDGVYLDVSSSAFRLLGYHENELLGRSVYEFFHPTDIPTLKGMRDTLVNNPKSQILPHRYRHKDGLYIWIESNIQAVRDASGQVVEFVAVSRDITERKQADARIEFLAHHDPLTNLPNRLLGKDRLELAVARAERSGTKAALLFLDLDQFKKVNDSLGHSVGDALLQAVSTRLQGCLRESDTLSRQGGDEFLILIEELHDVEAASRVAEALLDGLSSPFTLDDQELYISGSIGIAVYPDDGSDFDTLLKKADTAMYHAKDVGRNAFRFFTDQMNVDTTEYLNLRNGLRRALERQEFVLHYQPQVSLRNGDIVGVEALIRWQHPDLGLIPPGRFIPVAEDSGLIVPVGAWVLKEACQQAAAWHKMGFEGLVVAVNLSAAQFKRGDLLSNISSALAESALDPECLELELTESILISDTNKVLSMVDRLKQLGVKLSIDDFGTGYSSLAYLKRFHVDKLKIDQSFVRDITSDANDAAIVYAIVQMARSLGLATIAEGVENEQALAALRDQGCDEAQGFFFARPMPAAELEEFLRQPRQRMVV
ncbi:EAL domain-containing protein [Telmatospirillum sp.]|uniref:putative bifunctional diguanylate cyclase/phosphodiesterase n=1 Tax=Telmatospirillum sp. TaxID=2079197 RepID=UPI002847DC73|nr:EAL domain-containing protein [Telmatospirillum sp.]MDR3436163.1 EAL domain-containing protein [Telmatospirillum sp.]